MKDHTGEVQIEINATTLFRLDGNKFLSNTQECYKSTSNVAFFSPTSLHYGQLNCLIYPFLVIREKYSYLLGGKGGRFSPFGKKEATTSAA